jgi:3-hydroxyacyl-[acyl-carrier-protein] dehydratase
MQQWNNEIPTSGQVEITESMMHCEEILAKMPYARPFLFVDEFTEITNEGAKGHYTYREDESFYQGHFPGNPVTPGVIMTETMAQIGLVGLGMYLTGAYKKNVMQQFVFTSSEVFFRKKVMPGETVFVESTKVYFRFKALKCKVEMKNELGEVVCHGTLSGAVLK